MNDTPYITNTRIKTVYGNSSRLGIILTYTGRIAGEDWYVIKYDEPIRQYVCQFKRTHNAFIGKESGCIIFPCDDPLPDTSSKRHFNYCKCGELLP
jgi:hypothetical protein